MQKYKESESHIDVNGYVWNQYTIEFDSPEGTFSFRIYAVSYEHAELLVESIKENARVNSTLIGESHNK